MLFPDYSDAQIVIAAIFYKEHRAEPPIMSFQELRDEPLLADLAPRWLQIADKVNRLSNDVREQMAASYRKKFRETIEPNTHDTPMFGSTREPVITPTGKIARGWQGRLRGKQ